MTINPKFWKGRKVLITGHTGFKGSWLSIWLQEMEANIRGISLDPPTQPSLFAEANVRNGLDHYVADIRDSNQILKLIREFQPEIIFHLAAQSLVRHSYLQPLETYSTNVMGTVNVLDAARYTDSVRAIINVTTDKCYENREWDWGYRENEPMGGFDPYSSSKGCSELISSSYRNSFFQNSEIALATARAGNVIGGGDWATDRLIPDILKGLESNMSIQIRNPNAIRPWQHVLEPLSGYLILAQNLLIKKKNFAEPWNFGPNDDDARPVNWIVEKICEKWGPNANWKTQDGDHPHEANYLKLDISKARNRLQWVPQWKLETALSKIVEWHKDWTSGQDARTLCVTQINQYQNIL